MRLGLFVWAAAMLFALLIGCSPPQAAAVALMGATIAAVAVELKDFQAGRTFDWLDLLATILLPAVGTLLMILLPLYVLFKYFD